MPEKCFLKKQSTTQNKQTRKKMGQSDTEKWSRRKTVRNNDFFLLSRTQEHTRRGSWKKMGTRDWERKNGRFSSNDEGVKLTARTRTRAQRIAFFFLRQNERKLVKEEGGKNHEKNNAGERARRT
jgi:hypothetical protein